MRVFASRSARWRYRKYSAWQFTASGEVFRACSLSWRNGECLGARFVSAKELRGSVETEKAEPEPEKAAG